ncbi:hypothetical protein TRAPUB_12206 [Trametes pubescens]|uniref:Uncharacterized protein n=1 Tax=Trametes pubescens TaxID=154538 RepID=A0A1M2VUR8_TRAPU|nr:hypothetical protein TRAPUB_12206 [Trametes pubescens]
MRRGLAAHVSWKRGSRWPLPHAKPSPGAPTIPSTQLPAYAACPLGPGKALCATAPTVYVASLSIGPNGLVCTYLISQDVKGTELGILASAQDQRCHASSTGIIRQGQFWPSLLRSQPQGSRSVPHVNRNAFARRAESVEAQFSWWMPHDEESV